MELQSNLVNSKCSGLEILLRNMCGSRGGDRESSPPPPEKYKFIGFPSNTGPDPLKITKLPSQHSTMGHYRPASETPFQWRFAGRPIIARFWWSLEPLSPKPKQKKYQSWTPSDKIFWIRACEISVVRCIGR